MRQVNTTLAQGRACPLGATVYPDGVNFSVFSKSSAALELLLFDRADDVKPSVVIPLDPRRNRTYHYWHAFVPGIGPGRIYGYRAFGSCDPPEDADKVPRRSCWIQAMWCNPARSCSCSRVT